MPRRSGLGTIRRSQILTMAGPGAIVDFRTSKAPVSAVTIGLEHWPQGTILHEHRLEQRLQKKEFRAPPVFVDDTPPRGHPIEAVRFPKWQQCPNCFSLRRSGWASETSEPAMYCSDCSGNKSRKTYVIPAPFVVACENGHLDEFPWNRWVRHQAGCQNRELLTLRSEGVGGLAGLRLSCPKCGANTTMEGCFDRDALRRFGTCAGSRPWLPNAPSEQCTLVARTLQRGASNMYFPVVVSALDIPPWSDGLQQRLKRDWDRMITLPEDRLRGFVMSLGLAADVGLSEEELIREILRRRAQAQELSVNDLREDEYRQLAADTELPRDEDAEFEVRVEAVPAEVRPWVSRLVRVVRLREVRVLRAFTRVRYPDPETPNHLPTWAQLSETPQTWLPAVEVRGEGIFVELTAERIEKWSAGFGPIAERIHKAYEEDWKVRHPEVPAPLTITPKVLLVHTLAHALIRQLSLECGYSAASLRERLYVSEKSSGFLIYTAAPDSDGTLGGLSRQGRADAFVATLQGALRAQQWCASDPLCIAGAHSQSERASGAACHSCLLVAETSCEEFNRLLDRRTLVGAPEDSSLGFFAGSTLLE